MARFTTRVELHSADYADYLRLHEEMAKEGYWNRISDQAGNLYHLPPAEYIIERNITIDDALLAAKQAANRTGKTSSILTTEALQWRWLDLPIASLKSA